MISVILFMILVLGMFIPIFMSIEGQVYWPWIIWIFCIVIWAIPFFTGIHIKNSEGQYKGYITAIEQNGTFFKGYNVYLKTDLTSSNEDKACVDRDNSELINKLKEAQEKKENLVLEYESVWQYAIGECPGSNFMIINIK